LGLGFRPLIVRSASMVPTLRVGDVVVVEPVHVAQLHRGDIITLPDGKGQLLTHRVRTLSRSGDAIDIETRGDANRQSEYFNRDLRTQVGRIAFSVPAVGRLIVALGSPLARWFLGVIGAALVLVTIATNLPSGMGRASSGAPTS